MKGKFLFISSLAAFVLLSGCITTSAFPISMPCSPNCSQDLSTPNECLTVCEELFEEADVQLLSYKKEITGTFGGKTEISCVCNARQEDVEKIINAMVYQAAGPSD